MSLFQDAKIHKVSENQAGKVVIKFKMEEIMNGANKKGPRKTKSCNTTTAHSN